MKHLAQCRDTADDRKGVTFWHFFTSTQTSQKYWGWSLRPGYWITYLVVHYTVSIKRRRLGWVHSHSHTLTTMTSQSANKAIIKNADMSEEMQQRAIDCAKDAMNQFTIEKDIAAYLKKEFDKLYSPTWHCIVGRNFGRWVLIHVAEMMYTKTSFYLFFLLILFSLLATWRMKRKILSISTWVKWLFCSSNPANSLLLQINPFPFLFIYAILWCEAVDNKQIVVAGLVSDPSFNKFLLARRRWPYLFIH